jgi:hypothetical protein
MARNVSSAERIQRAHVLIQQARSLPIPQDGGKYNFSYIAQVKDLLRQARDLVKFIPLQPTTTPEMKKQVEQVFAEADRANQEILH